MKNIKPKIQLIQNWYQGKNQLLWQVSAVVILAIVLIWQLVSGNTSSADKNPNGTEKIGEKATERPLDPSQSVDTYIPAGFVLVPIDVINFESLDSLLGPQGVVDLFLSSNPTKKGMQAVARRVKILRAPLNPSRFAVLVREDETKQILQSAGPFYVVIQNPKQVGTQFVHSENRTSRVSYD